MTKNFEPDPATTLDALIAAAQARASECADYPDTPEQAAEHSRLTEALWPSQAESMARLPD